MTHIFYKDNALFVTQESIPEKPSTKYFRSEESIDATGKALSKYFDEIAAIKGRAVWVGNEVSKQSTKDTITFLLGQNEEGAFVEVDVSADGTLRPIDCEVRMHRDCKKCGVIPDGECKQIYSCDFRMPDKFPPNRMVAILSPSKVVEKEESQDEWFKVFNVCTQMEKYAAIETLQSLYTITRRS